MVKLIFTTYCFWKQRIHRRQFVTDGVCAIGVISCNWQSDFVKWGSFSYSFQKRCIAWRKVTVIYNKSLCLFFFCKLSISIIFERIRYFSPIMTYDRVELCHTSKQFHVIPLYQVFNNPHSLLIPLPGIDLSIIHGHSHSIPLRAATSSNSHNLSRSRMSRLLLIVVGIHFWIIALLLSTSACRFSWILYRWNIKKLL